jgi:hypothetical protein
MRERKREGKRERERERERENREFCLEAGLFINRYQKLRRLLENSH